MTGRERILATLDRQKPDCIPFEIGGTDCSSVHVIPYKKLRARLGLADGPIRVRLPDPARGPEPTPT